MSNKTIIVGGYGVGISKAVAEKFGAEGFSVALVARNAERLAAGVAALEAKGVKAAAFPANLGDSAAVKALVGHVREKLGPIGVVQWTAYSGSAGDLLTADVAGLHDVFDVAVTGLLAAVQAALPDLKKDKGAVLVTNGGLGFSEPKIDAMAVQWNAMGLALAAAAKHKLAGLLAEKLKADGVYVGEVVVLGAVKGTSFDQGQATLEASKIADKFWEIYSARSPSSVTIE
jgi:short-subunit dehydrogenase